MGTTSVLLGSGGALIQVLKDKYINKCLLGNLCLSVDLEDLHELFDEFFTLKNIKLLPVEQGASYQTAEI